jgi:hypothetical protein
MQGGTGTDVAFRVAVKDGKVALTARPVTRQSDNDSGEPGDR